MPEDQTRTVTEVTRRHHPNTFLRRVKVCAYVRVSTGHDGQQNSLQNQTQYYEQKFIHTPQLQLIGIFSDTGISGISENRPGFKAMLAKARSGEIDLIYTKSISRFARNTLLLLKVVREQRLMDVGIIFEEQNINTLHAEGELMLSVLAGIAEEEQKSVRSNIQWTMQKRFLSGKVMVDTNRLIGYDKDETGKLVINHQQAEVVKTIFQMYLSGISGYTIAQVLNQKQIPTYTKHPWTSNRILRIISNEKYMGACLMQKSFVDEDGRQVQNHCQRDRYWVDDDHPAIITRADWDQAQRIRKSRVRKTYPFTRLLYCVFCGTVMIRVSNTGGYVSWICYRYLRKGKDSCIGTRISEARLIEITKNHPITSPTIVKEVTHGKNSRQKSYRFTPVSKQPLKKPSI